jgi:hypothetical protein
MRLEAQLTSADLQHALFQLTPLTLSLDPDSPHRHLALKTPTDVVLVAGQGLRVVTEVQLQWDLIGVRVPVTLRRVSILLSPRIIEIDSRPVLAFGLRIEEADLSAIPAFLRDVLVARVNDALAKPEARIAWHFMDTLDFSFNLPREVQPSFAMRVFARSGHVQVDADAVRLSIDWGLYAEADRSAHSDA